ncbi:hypothetical protein YC2023_059467 [Brassica napus]
MSTLRTLPNIIYLVDGQGLETGKETCKQTKWGKHKNLTCLFVSPKLGLRTGVKREKNLEHEVHLENFYCQPNNNNKNLISVSFMYYYFLPNNVKNHSPIRMKISKSIVDDEFGVTLVIMIYCWEIPRPFTFFRLGIVGVTGFRRKNIFNGLA